MHFDTAWQALKRLRKWCQDNAVGYSVSMDEDDVYFVVAGEAWAEHEDLDKAIDKAIEKAEKAI